MNPPASEEQASDGWDPILVQTYVLNGLAIAAMFWGLMYPRPYRCAIALLAVLPVLAIGFTRWSHGVATLESRRGSTEPSVFAAAVVPAMAMAVRADIDWHVLDWSRFWVPFAVLGGTLTALLWFVAMPDDRRRGLSMAILSVAFLAHGFGLVLFLNGTFDRSTPAVYSSRVVARHINGGKSRTYLVTLNPWIDGRSVHEVSVGRSTYEQHPEGTAVRIEVRPGDLHIPWFNVR